MATGSSRAGGSRRRWPQESSGCGPAACKAPLGGLVAAALVPRIRRNTTVLAEAAPRAGTVARGPVCAGTLGGHSPQH